jgi:hypothetical protein
MDTRAPLGRLEDAHRERRGEVQETTPELKQPQEFFFGEPCFSDDCQESPTLDFIMAWDWHDYLVFHHEDVTPSLSDDPETSFPKRFDDVTP